MTDSTHAQSGWPTPPPHGQVVDVLDLLAEGGSITVQGRRNPTGDGWQFRVCRDESFFEELEPTAFPPGTTVDTGPWLDTWDAAVAILERTAWRCLVPDVVHQGFLPWVRELYLRQDDAESGRRRRWRCTLGIPEGEPGVGQEVFKDTPEGRTDLHVWGPILREGGDRRGTFNLRDPKAVAERVASRSQPAPVRKLTEEHPEYYPDVLEPEKTVEVDYDDWLNQLRSLPPTPKDRVEAALARLKAIQKTRHDNDLY